MNPNDSWAPIREYSPGKRGRRFPWEITVLLVLVAGPLAWFLVPAYVQSQRAAEERMIIDHVYRYLVAADRFFEQNPGRIFVRHDEIAALAGPQPPPFAPVAGENYEALFPIRRDHPELTVTTADGRRVTWFMYAGWTGLPERGLVTERADGELVGSTDVIAAYHKFRAGEKPDGVHEKKFRDGTRFEITYRAGVPHGPFRAFHADGKPWGEANYEGGRVTGPCWNHPREGPRFDESRPPDYTAALKNVP